MIHLRTPLKDEDIRKLEVGDKVLLSGVIFTARDRAHEFLLKNNFPKVYNSVIYHCGPLVKKKKNHYEIIAAGPTTSQRMSMYSGVIKKYGIKAVMGKGGMDGKTLGVLKNQAVYLSAVGGAALIYADCIKKVRNVYKLEFGIPEAIWELEIKDFPAVVTMDSHGGNLHKQILKKSQDNLVKFISKL